MKLLLLSNSTNKGEQYLQWCIEAIASFLGKEPKTAVFIPYAAVTFSYEEYTEKVDTQFREHGHQVLGIHTFKNPVEAIENAEAIVVGGGNTFQLLHHLQEQKLIEPIRNMINKDIPYIGWSAGSNVACPTLCTTNDMPIIQPYSFNALNVIPFQINPHYTDENPTNHAGETREMRIEEYLQIQPEKYVTGLREGTFFHIDGNTIHYFGSKTLRIFKKDMQPLELGMKDNIDFLLKEGSI